MLHHKLIVLGVLLAAIVSFSTPTAAAQTLDDKFSVGDRGITNVDFSQISIANLGNVIADGSISEFDASAKLLPSRRWQADDPLATVLQLGDVPTLGTGQFSMEQIEQLLGQSPHQVRLSQYKLLISQSLPKLIGAIPYLKNFKVKDVAPIRELLGSSTEDTRTLDSIANQPEFANRSLAALGASLDRYVLADIPNAAATPIQTFSNWQQQSFNDIPGLSQIPLSKMPQPVPNQSTIVARIASMPGAQTEPILNSVTGSTQAGFRVACPGNDGVIVKQCAGVVLDAVDVGEKSEEDSLRGKQWILGSSQVVPGGFGALQTLPSPIGIATGYEPTGRHPFGSAFKQVLEEVNGQTVTSLLVFRVCSIATCSPYNQFAVPFMQYQVGDLIIIGADNTATSESDRMITPPNHSYQSVNLGQCTGESVGGISVSTLTTAIAQLQSNQSDSTSIGLFTCTNDHQCGRSLGQYQLPSYAPSVQSVISAKSGGEEWLKKIGDGEEPSREDLLKFFPPEVQTQILTENTKALLELSQSQIDPTTQATWSDSRLIERVAQMSVGGKSSVIDSEALIGLEGLSLRQYGLAAKQNYSAQGGGLNLQCSSEDLAQQSVQQTPSAKISRSLERLGKFSTGDSPGAGTNSAAWAVNRVLSTGGIRPLGEHPNYIPSIEADLQRRGSPIDPNQAQGGDIVIAAGRTHIGICLDRGCRKVRSNNGIRKAFEWDSSANFGQKFGGSTLYRVTQP